VAAVSPYIAPAGFLTALDAVATAADPVCIPRVVPAVVGLDVAITTDQGPLASSFAMPLDCGPLCPETPGAGCAVPVASGKASLLLKDVAKDANDQLLWKWLNGGATSTAAFGDPLTTTDYGLCIYDATAGTPSLVFQATAPAGGLCGGNSCWKAVGKGFKYTAKVPAPPSDGLQSIILNAGASGQAKVIVQGKGGELPLPSLPLAQDPTVTVQLRNTIGQCWEAEYTTAVRNEPGLFNAKSD
jgi:hypothetical protein